MVKEFTTTQKHYYTPEEYLELEAKAEYKSEYLDGKIIPMTGGTTNHNKIAGNFYRQFPLTIVGQDYDIYIGDVRLWIPEYRHYTYPDIMIIKGETVYEGKGTTTITNPLIIMEVLSKSTQQTYKTSKFGHYRSLPSFQEYILVDQYSYYVEQYVKQKDEQWLLRDYKGKESMLALANLEFEISFLELYKRVSFTQKD